jgi:hypothetical protein
MSKSEPAKTRMGRAMRVREAAAERNKLRIMQAAAEHVRRLADEGDKR